MNPLHDASTDEYILEARIYYSRKIDGEKFGIRGFYTHTSYVGDLFEDEKGLGESIDGLENFPNPDNTARDWERAKYEKMKLSYISKLKNESYYKDSLLKYGVEKAPPLKDFSPQSDKIYKINF